MGLPPLRRWRAVPLSGGFRRHPAISYGSFLLAYGVKVAAVARGEGEAHSVSQPQPRPRPMRVDWHLYYNILYNLPPSRLAEGEAATDSSGKRRSRCLAAAFGFLPAQPRPWPLSGVGCAVPEGRAGLGCALPFLALARREGKGSARLACGFLLPASPRRIGLPP